MVAQSSLNASGLSLLNASPQGLASDARSVDTLRQTASRDPKAAIKETARQFEALFMQELMKSMRQANVSAGMLDNTGSQMGTEMLDGQYASMMTGMPGGLSEAIARQLDRQMSQQDKPEGDVALPLKSLDARIAPAAAKVSDGEQRTGKALSASQQNQADFVQRHTAAAHTAAQETGIPAGFLVAQAAHESGWGRREIKMADGSHSFNVFGIKAGPSWKGKVAEIVTTEYHNGQAQKVTAKFRAYDSYEESFQDYARMLKNSPRYSQVIAKANTAEGFAQGLQRAGYATDPAYADKLTKVINTTLRLQRMVT